jgi:hypothetical protein
MQEFYWSIPLYLAVIMIVCLGLVIVWGGSALIVQIFVKPPWGY